MYVCLPALLIWARTNPRTILAFVGLLIASGALAYATKKAFGTSLAAAWMPVTYGHLFLFGALAWRWRDAARTMSVSRANAWAWSAVAAFIAALCLDLPLRGEVIGIATLVLLVVLRPGRARPLIAVLTKPIMLYLGTISCSIYLTHFVIIYLLGHLGLLHVESLAQFAQIVLATVAMSTLSYLWIERPTNRIGARRVAMIAA